MAVFVLDKKKQQLMPCSEKRARLLLQRGRARVHKMYPFTIRIVDRKIDSCAVQPLTLKLDPGSKQTGIAIVRTSGNTANVVSLIDVKHRGAAISKALKQRAGYRRRRRSCNLRYRAPRFDNRPKSNGWLAPSLQHRVDTVVSTVQRLIRLAPIGSIAQELVRFDMQIIENPEISGVGYQQGTLAGYEIREYVFAKWGRKCAYCDKENVPLNLDHVRPRCNGGSDRLSNLVPACIPCNQRKGSLAVEVSLKNDLVRLDKILKGLKTPLKDAAAVNSTRWTLFNALKCFGLPVSTGSGGRTKWNRHRLGIPKTHALDAVCVGNMQSIESIRGQQQPTLLITATGRGSYQRTRVNASGFPRGFLMRTKTVHGFKTGDMVKAVVPVGKKQGSYFGRVAIRATGSFNIQTQISIVQGVSFKHCQVVQRGNGYAYELQHTSRKACASSLA
jgi:hypothetical protein